MVKIDKTISDLTDQWHGADAIEQVNKLIDVRDVLADNPRAIHLYQKMGLEKSGDVFSMKNKI